MALALTCAVSGSVAAEEYRTLVVSVYAGSHSPSMKVLHRSTVFKHDPHPETEGTAVARPSLGLGATWKYRYGLRIRAGYHLRTSGRITYEKTLYEDDEEEVVFLEPCRPVLKYSLHMFSSSFVYHHMLREHRAQAYVGLGGAFIAVQHSWKGYKTQWGRGFTCFPVAGLDLWFTERMGARLEYQHHFGGTIMEHRGFAPGLSTVEDNFRYALKGPYIMIALNIGFQRHFPFW